jgi:hypothetical protein
VSAAPVMSLRSQFDIGLAAAKDDAEIRMLLSRIVVPGAIQVAFEREPRFFDSCVLHGDLCQVVVGRDRYSGRLIGMGTRSVAQAFVNGRPNALGYLSDLRLDSSHRGGTLVARGYRLFRELHADGATRLYTTIIFSSNQLALSTIAQGRAGLPRYHDMGGICCPGINLRARKPELRGDFQIRKGSHELLPQIIDCLNRNSVRRQFAPVHHQQDFQPGGRWRDCVAENFYVAVRDGEVIGALAVWDQSSFKQTRIIGYDRKLSWSVPFINTVRKLAGCAQYPRPGEYLSFFHISFIAIDRDDVAVFRALLRQAYNDAVGSGYIYAMVTLHERDPLLVALDDYSLTPFNGRLFCVCNVDGEEEFQQLDQRVPYVEAAIF